MVVKTHSRFSNEDVADASDDAISTTNLNINAGTFVANSNNDVANTADISNSKSTSHAYFADYASSNVGAANTQDIPARNVSVSNNNAADAHDDALPIKYSTHSNSKLATANVADNPVKTDRCQ